MYSESGVGNEVRIWRSYGFLMYNANSGGTSSVNATGGRVETYWYVAT